MKPEEGTIFIVDDTEPIVDFLSLRLAEEGYQTTGATRRQEALNNIPHLGTYGVKAVILDGDLGHVEPDDEPHDYEKYRGNHGQEILDRIRETYGEDIKAIGISGMHVLDGAEVMVNKINTEAVIEAVKNL